MHTGRGLSEVATAPRYYLVVPAAPPPRTTGVTTVAKGRLLLWQTMCMVSASTREQIRKEHAVALMP
eukprot:7826475-Pyramimonas_sp.AAC.1